MEKSKADKKNPLSGVTKAIRLHDCSRLKVLHRKNILIIIESM